MGQKDKLNFINYTESYHACSFIHETNIAWNNHQEDLLSQSWHYCYWKFLQDIEFVGNLWWLSWKVIFYPVLTYVHFWELILSNVANDKCLCTNMDCKVNWWKKFVLCVIMCSCGYRYPWRCGTHIHTHTRAHAHAHTHANRVTHQYHSHQEITPCNYWEDGMMQLLCMCLTPLALRNLYYVAHWLNDVPLIWLWDTMGSEKSIELFNRSWLHWQNLVHLVYMLDTWP